MIRPGTVITEGLGAVRPHKYRAGMTDLRHQCLRIHHGQLQVLRCNTVADGTSFGQILDEDKSTAIPQRGANHIGARHLWQQPINTFSDSIQISRIGANQNRLGKLIVLRLRKKIHRHPIRRRCAIGDNQNFRRPGNHVNPHRTEYVTLGVGHIGITRTDNLVDLRHRLCAISQRTYGLGAANGEYPINAGNGRSCQYQWVTLATWRWYHHDQFLHPCHLGWNGIHQYRGRIRSFTTGHIQTDTIQRCNALTQHGAVCFGVRPALDALPLVEGTDALCRRFQGITLIFRQGRKCILKFSTREFELMCIMDIEPIKLAGKFKQRGIAALTDIRKNIEDNALDAGILFSFERQQVFKFGIKSR